MKGPYKSRSADTSLLDISESLPRFLANQKVEGSSVSATC